MTRIITSKTRPAYNPGTLYVYDVTVLGCGGGGGANVVTMKSATFITPGIKLNRFILFARKVDLLAFSG